MDQKEMDRGIWAIWYDLPEEGKEEYAYPFGTG
jgi:hypothetical protein